MPDPNRRFNQKCLTLVWIAAQRTYTEYYEVDAVISGIQGSENCVFVVYVCVRVGQVNPFATPKNEGELECLAQHACD